MIFESPFGMYDSESLLGLSYVGLDIAQLQATGQLTRVRIFVGALPTTGVSRRYWLHCTITRKLLSKERPRSTT